MHPGSNCLMLKTCHRHGFRDTLEKLGFGSRTNNLSEWMSVARDPALWAEIVEHRSGACIHAKHKFRQTTISDSIFSRLFRTFATAGIHIEIGELVAMCMPSGGSIPTIRCIMNAKRLSSCRTFRLRHSHVPVYRK